MTTITNFLHANFVSAQSQSEGKERPVWIVAAKPHLKINFLRDYLVDQSKTKNIPLIHIDLGISQIKKYSQLNSAQIQVESGLKLLKPIKDKAYYIVKWRHEQRKKQNCLQNLTAQLQTFAKSQIMKKQEIENNLPAFMKNCYGIFVEGLQLMSTLPSFHQQIESFINQLSNLPLCFKQLIVFTNSSSLNEEISFALERISSCLTTLTNYNEVDGIWRCTSTVRRYTGFSNEQEYVIRKVGKQVKVEKWVQKIETGETMEQKEMVKSLNFVVKKDEEEKKRQKELKKIIYPHLRVQDMCQGGKKNCGECSKQEQEMDLIVLDEEQEDEDDLDV